MPSAKPRRDEAGPAPPRVRLMPEARDALRSALTGRPDGTGVRIWVERGLHPHAQMMLDKPSSRDVPVELDGVLLLLDEASRSFLEDAEIRYRTDRAPAGFEVVSPRLPAAGAPPAPSGPPAPGVAADVDGRVREALKSIFDPEIPMNIIDLGLIYAIGWKAPGELEIRMTMTSPGCPAVEELVAEVQRVAAPAAGADRAHVEVVWEPPWGPEKMSDFAKRQFGYA